MRWRGAVDRAVLAMRAAGAVRRAGGPGKRRARAYLASLLGGRRGLAAKAAQLAAGTDPLARAALNDAAEPLAFAEIAAALSRAWGRPWPEVLEALEEKGRPASIGQVHFGRLRNGCSVAVKVLFPRVVEEIEEELHLMGMIPRVGPARRWGFDLEGYVQAFRDNLGRETDYVGEASRQARYRGLCPPDAPAVVAEVSADLCAPGVLVQSREDGLDLEQVAGRDLSARASMARALLRHHLAMLFRHGLLHGDPHPANFAFRFTEPAGWTPVLYDFGCVLELPETERLALLRAILAAREREPLDPASVLAALGFDPAKLADLRPVLPALMNLILEPFITRAPFDAGQWRLGERFDAVAGEHKWWFRSAGPPRFLLLMRAIHGLARALERLGADVDWAEALDEAAPSSLRARARALELPAPARPAPGFDGMARNLHVLVERGSRRVAEVSMPARMAEDLRAVMDEAAQESARRAGVDMNAVQTRVLRSGLAPQEIFNLTDPDRRIRVWLE